MSRPSSPGRAAKRSPAEKTGPRDGTVYAVSLGCARNLVDTERFLAGMARRGYRLAGRAEDASVIFVNTCAFIAEAVEESRDYLEQLAAFAGTRPGTELLVAGCLVSRLGRSLVADYPAISRLIHPSELAGLNGRSPCTPAHYGYLKIADGCRNRCSYCLIPSLRGPLKSLPARQILSEARALAGAGALELNLIAQDTTAWGVDRRHGRKLADLLDSLCRITGPRWIRLLYTYPDGYDRELVETLARNLLDPFGPPAGKARICPYLDLPLQHASDPVLAAMNRRGRAASYRELVGRLRERLPNLALRTTFIVGFPGESEADFARLLDFVRETRFHKLGVFRYSREPGTPAHDLPGQVPEEIKEERFRALMEIQAGISRSLSADLVGRELEILVEGEDPDRPGQAIGRTCFDAPEVDGFVRLDRAFPAGSLVRARVTGFSDYDLEAEAIPGPPGT